MTILVSATEFFCFVFRGHRILYKLFGAEGYKRHGNIEVHYQVCGSKEIRRDGTKAGIKNTWYFTALIIFLIFTLFIQT